jgi:hypothetical protein
LLGNVARADYRIIGWTNIPLDKRRSVCNGGWGIWQARSTIPVDGWRLSICAWENSKATSCKEVARVAT